MSTRVRVGDVEIKVDADLTSKQLRSLLRLAAGIQLGLAEAKGEEEPKTVIGFSAHVERESTEMAETYYEDEE